MLCRAILGLLPEPGAQVLNGEVLLKGEDLLCLHKRDMARVRGREIGFIPQEPMSSLNPVLTIGDQLVETLRQHQRLSGTQLTVRAGELLHKMHIPSPQERLRSYPHEMSGGMRQRALAAIALSGTPALLLADEPTTALDPTIQLQLLLLLREIQQQSGCAILFVTHDFGLVVQLCHRVSVMYAGCIVETAPVEALFKRPSHPYSEALLASVPKIATRSERLPSIAGQPPPLSNLPRGCTYAPRCHYGMPQCHEESPPDVRLAEDHHVACWRHA
jgi:oligopeptide/dipeptide ABC transporter ATP-binding protein